MSVYPPREDSFLLKRYLEDLDLDGEKVLDMGTGTGILALTMSEKGAEVTAVDTNPEAVKKLEKRLEDRNLEVDVFCSDLFEQVEKKFDLIVFNPPYLPGEPLEGDEKWRGGEKGIELVESFLDRSESHLKPGGEVLMVGSSRSEVEELIDRDGVEVVETRELWFETVYLLSYS